MRRVPLSTALVGIALSLAPAVPLQAQSSAWDRLLALEKVYPRLPYEALFIGTFDASTGSFTGPTSEPPEKDCDTAARHPHCSTVPGTVPVVASRGEQIGFTFEVANHRGPFTVTVNGTTVTGAPSAARVTVPVTWAVGPRPNLHSSLVRWSIAVDGKRRVDSLRVDRQAFGFGVFTLPLLPVAIVYDPPQDPARDNTSTFTTSQTHGTSVTVSFSAGHGGDSSYTPAEFAGLDVAAKQLKIAATVMAAVAGGAGAIQAGGAAAGSASAGAAASGSGATASDAAAASKASSLLDQASSIFQDLFGKSTVTDSWMTTQTSGGTLMVSVTMQQGYKTARLGPGKGDAFVYMSGVPVAWFEDGYGNASVTLLGTGRRGYSTIPDLQSDLAAIRAQQAHVGPQSKLDSLSIQALLALDPFVAGGNDVALTPTRFDSLPPPFGLDALAQTFELSITNSNTQRQGTQVMNQTVEKDQAGLLASGLLKGSGANFGLGPDSTANITTTLNSISTTEQSTSEQQKMDFVLGGPGMDTLTENAYYDRVFGGVAVRIVPSGPDVVAGSIADSGSAPPPGMKAVQLAGAQAAQSTSPTSAHLSDLAGRRVTLVVGSYTYETRTDHEGRYAFHIPHNTRPVAARITIGNGEATQMLMLSSAHVSAPVMQLAHP